MRIDSQNCELITRIANSQPELRNYNQNCSCALSSQLSPTVHIHFLLSNRDVNLGRLGNFDRQLVDTSGCLTKKHYLDNMTKKHYLEQYLLPNKTCKLEAVRHCMNSSALRSAVPSIVAAC